MATIKSGFVWSDEPENFEDNNAIAIRLNKMMEDAEVIGGGGAGDVFDFGTFAAPVDYTLDLGTY